jgi:adenine-specific DNA-methyltransferase
MRTLPNECIDLALPDPPYLVNYTPRDRRRIASDTDGDWLEPAYAELYRVLKPNTLCLTFYGWPQVDRFMSVWKQCGFRPVSHFAFVKEYASTEGYTEGFHEVAYLLAKGRPERPAMSVRDVLDFRYTGNPLHPNQKPVDLIQKLIESFSKRGDVILDPFAGSGTTGIAAHNCGRAFILIEKVWRYFNAAQYRLAERH